MPRLNVGIDRQAGCPDMMLKLAMLLAAELFYTNYSQINGIESIALNIEQLLLLRY